MKEGQNTMQNGSNLQKEIEEADKLWDEAYKLWFSGFKDKDLILFACRRWIDAMQRKIRYDEEQNEK